MSGTISMPNEQTPPCSYSSNNTSLEIVQSQVELGESDHTTTLSLQQCRKLVLSRYHKLLIFIACHPFGQRRWFLHPNICRLLNCIYVVFVVCSLVYSYVYEIIFCAGQVKTVPPEPLMPTVIPHTTIDDSNSTSNYSHFSPWTEIQKLKTIPDTTAPICHEITIYAIPNVIPLIVFALAFCHFRIKENEELDALIERVFLQANCMFGAQEKLITTARRFLIFAGIWGIFSIGTFGLSLAAYGLPDKIMQIVDIDQQWLVVLLICIEFVGKVYCTCIYIAIILNYGIQCEFIICSIRYICLQLNERTPNLRESMHEILRVRELISKINGYLSKMTSLCLATCALRSIIGILILLTTSEKNAVGWTYRAFFPLAWIPMLVFPLIQAARVTKTGEKLRQISFELRVFGYRNCDQNNLDSFILFINSAKLRTKLFSITIKPAYIISSFAIVAFIILLLFQTNVIHTSL